MVNLAKCLQESFENCFGAWSRFVAKWTCTVFFISFVLFVYLSKLTFQALTFSLGSSFFSFYSKFEDESIIWTTAGNPSLQNKFASELLFEGAASIRPITLGFEAK